MHYTVKENKIGIILGLGDWLKVTDQTYHAPDGKGKNFTDKEFEALNYSKPDYQTVYMDVPENAGHVMECTTSIKAVGPNEYQLVTKVIYVNRDRLVIKWEWDDPELDWAVSSRRYVEYHG